MPRPLTKFQEDVMAQLALGDARSFDIALAIDKSDSSVHTTLCALRDVHKCAHISGYIAGHRGIFLAIWAAGEGVDAAHPNPKRPARKVVNKTVASRDDALREFRKRRVAAKDYINKHLTKQNTPFGWLLENAHG